jgi:ABC-type lipoprotein release transport system permease subunit
VAVGATSSVVAYGVVREGLLLSAVGVALGLPCAVRAARALRSLMFGISEADPPTFIAVAFFFLALGAIADWAPPDAPPASTR